MRRSSRKITAIDLFSGAGGVTEGYRQAGVNVIAAVEIDQTAIDTYKKNHRRVRVIREDLRTYKLADILSATKLQPGELGILTACAPCQTFSALGVQHRDPDDERSDLVLRVGDFVEGLLPRAFVMENVPRLALDDRFRKLCKRLRDLGYGLQYSIVNAADIGVPQRRKRLVLIALHGIDDEAVPKLNAKNPVFKRFAKHQTVKDAFARLVDIDDSDPLHTARTSFPEHIANRIKAIPKNGGSHDDLPEELRLECHKRLRQQNKRGAASAYGRMKWEEVAPTLTTRCTTPACGRYLHPDQDRPITLREAATLQSFPLDYAFGGGSGAVQAQIGNAVPPRLAKLIATVVVSALNQHLGIGDRTETTSLESVAIGSD